MLGREKPTNQANTVEVVGLWRGKLARGDDSLTVHEKTYAIAKLIEDSRFWQVSGDIREW